VRDLWGSDDRALSPSPRDRLATYVCQRRGIAQAEPICQSIPGRGLDHAIGRVLLETCQPLTLEITLTIQQELQLRRDRDRRLHRRAVERARYDRSRRRRTCRSIRESGSSPTNWSHWNRALQQVTEAQEIYERHGMRTAWPSTRTPVRGSSRFATDFPRYGTIRTRPIANGNAWSVCS